MKFASILLLVFVVSCSDDTTKPPGADMGADGTTQNDTGTEPDLVQDAADDATTDVCIPHPLIGFCPEVCTSERAAICSTECATSSDCPTGSACDSRFGVRICWLECLTDQDCVDAGFYACRRGLCAL